MNFEDNGIFPIVVNVQDASLMHFNLKSVKQEPKFSAS